MNRFMGGFALAGVLLAAAAVAGYPWQGIGFAACAATVAVWLAVQWSRRRGVSQDQDPGRDASAPPFGMRDAAERHERVNRRRDRRPGASMPG